MKSIPLRVFLLLTTALFIAGCDQNPTGQTTDTSQKTDDAVGFYAPPAYSHDMPSPTVSGSFLAGQFAQSHADWSNASDYFARVLDVTPHEADIQRRVMSLDMGSGHYDKAVAIAQQLIKSKDGDVTLARLISALSSFKAGQYDAALTEIQEFQNDNLGIAVLPLLRIWADAGRGKVNLDALKDSPSLLYQAVLVAAYAKDKETLSQLAKAYDFTKTPTPIARLEDIAAIFASYNEKEEAKGIYRTLMMAIPERASFYDSQLKTLEGESSLPPLKEIATPQVALSEALSDMARLLSNGYQDSARLFAHMALYLNADNSLALELLAQIAADNGLYQEATGFLSRIDTTNAPDKQVQITRQTAQLLVESGQTEEAIRILQDLADKQNNIEAQIQIGDIHRNAGDYPQALKAYDAAYEMLDHKITAKYWDLSFARGMTHERLKNWDQAEKDLQTALLYEPDQPYVLNYLGYSWADKGTNLDKAAEMIEKAVRLKPDDGAIVDSLGWVYFRMGRFEKAVKTLEQAVELAPTEAEINDHLGDAYWRVGRKSEARFQWKRAASFSKDEAVTSTLENKVEYGLPDIPPRTGAEKVVESRK